MTTDRRPEDGATIVWQDSPLKIVTEAMNEYLRALYFDCEARRMIDREQVLHVARLARLRLSDDEVERMSSELSGILEHVERISALDLDDVEPTSHVIELQNVLRPDDPRQSWPREKILEPAPDPAEGAFRVPSPQV